MGKLEWILRQLYNKNIYFPSTQEMYVHRQREPIIDSNVRQDRDSCREQFIEF